MTLKFGTDGIRGPVETHMTPEACLKIGHATGLVMKEQGWDTVMIGKDTRVSGYMLDAKTSRCSNCIAFNQKPATLKKMAKALGD